MYPSIMKEKKVDWRQVTIVAQFFYHIYINNDSGDGKAVMK
jgi:hypothetical protein